jgi:hypothetical protein
MQNQKFRADLTGIRPIMFDRYAGDNKTKLSVLDKLYLNEANECTLPVLNIISLLSAQNTPSVAKRFYGKAARDMALGVQAFVAIEAVGTDPLAATIYDADGKAYTSKDERIRVMHHVARVDKGIPNPKERPMIPTGWRVSFLFEYQHNNFLSIEGLRTMIEQGGTLGLGTFRPIFGRYTVEFQKI